MTLFPSKISFINNSSPSPSFSLNLQHLKRSSSVHCPSINSSAAGMDSTAATSVYPLHRTKTIHLVRHAQGIHNVEGEKDHSAYLSQELFDAHLTPLGWQQVDNLHKHVRASGLSRKIELVIVSPLLRTMQTAVGAFGGEGYVNGIDVPPLMVANAGNSDRQQFQV